MREPGLVHWDGGKDFCDQDDSVLGRSEQTAG
ncbi:MAG: hypothetical protein UX91_C0007G0063 [Candidatus Amesbacteria bacterium GW2011_GWB1_47_19]|nr:MAG: hypothetical protein UW51_C0006G0116 [Candidatus Amesbacteria bacterium GW2011_GWA1_44_24]KKU31847.1 MAG: hypothetical protein UX46_C0002G0063 [Candidatus Amesbacteria bacterium GW2011_GWC1_46_24]KKU66783.1 MAG: hypothetical protein UX91_C0007G0063 [Candidatus Amesbacteria bacterium GW2011_GWB1_47_19]